MHRVHYFPLGSLVLFVLFWLVSSLWLIVNPGRNMMHLPKRGLQEEFVPKQTIFFYRLFGFVSFSFLLLFVVYTAKTVIQNQR